MAGVCGSAPLPGTQVLLSLTRSSLRPLAHQSGRQFQRYGHSEDGCSSAWRHQRLSVRTQHDPARPGTGHLMLARLPLALLLQLPVLVLHLVPPKSRSADGSREQP